MLAACLLPPLVQAFVFSPSPPTPFFVFLLPPDLKLVFAITSTFVSHTRLPFFPHRRILPLFSFLYLRISQPFYFTLTFLPAVTFSSRTLFESSLVFFFGHNCPAFLFSQPLTFENVLISFFISLFFIPHYPFVLVFLDGLLSTCPARWPLRTISFVKVAFTAPHFLEYPPPLTSFVVFFYFRRRTPKYIMKYVL